MLMIVGVIVLIIVNIIILWITARRYSLHGSGGVAITLIAPFQKAVGGSIHFIRGLWGHYFFLATVAQENERLRQALDQAVLRNNQFREIELSNRRLREFLNFQKTMSLRVIAAEVIGRDPSPYFKTAVIDKGSAEGLQIGMPVVIPKGVVGQVIEVSAHFSKVLLIIDRNSAVDALVQRTRARGIVKGASTNRCTFEYVLRKHEIHIGDPVISSGLDGVYPKGLRVGEVSEVVKRSSGIFQEVAMTPFVDFEKLEEVLIVLTAFDRWHQGVR